MQSGLTHVELDLRDVEPRFRHKLVFEAFNKLKEGEELVVIVDHYPEHLVRALSPQSEGISVEQTGTGEYVLKAVKKGSTPIVANISELRKLGDTFTPVPLLRKEEYGVVLVFFREGQYIPIHNPDSDLIFYVVQGKGKAYVGDREVELREGSILVVPKGVKRGIRAETYMEALHIVIPAPSPDDHEKIMKAAREGVQEVDLKR